MKFTSEDLMKAMGLQVGDRIKISVANNEFIYEIRLNAENKPYLLNEQNLINCGDVHSLIDMDFEILPRPKRVGELKCGNFDGCDNGCPLCWICCHYDPNILRTTHNDDTILYDVLNKFDFDLAEEIHDLLKARLDKEVE